MTHRRQLLKKYWQGNLSPEEYNLLIEDFRQHPNHPEFVWLHQHIWQNTKDSELLSPDASQRLLTNFQVKRAGPESVESTKRISPQWFMAAAVSSLMILGTIVWFLLDRTSLVVHDTSYGELQTVILPDSSEVILNANSSISYTTQWDNQAKREVWLDGEAYFSVTHTQNNQPFLVHINDGLQVEVLGTEFNIRERRTKAEVTLHEGSVQLEIHDQEDILRTLEMHPGEMVVVSEENQQVEQKEVNVDQHATWRDYKMVFRDLSLSQVAQRLEDIYGITISIESQELSETILTGAFPTQNLDMVLSSLQTIVSMEIEKNNNHIMFKPL